MCPCVDVHRVKEIRKLIQLNKFQFTENVQVEGDRRKKNTSMKGI